MDNCWILVIKHEFWSQLHMTGYIFKARRLSSSTCKCTILFLNRVLVFTSQPHWVSEGSVQAETPSRNQTHVSPSQHCHWASWEYLSWRAPTVLGLASDYYKDPPPLPRQALRTGQQKQRLWITLESMLSQLHQFVLYKDRPSILSSTMMLLISIYILITGSLWEHDSCNEKSGTKCHDMYVLWRKYQGWRPKHHKPQQRHCP